MEARPYVLTQTPPSQSPRTQTPTSSTTAQSSSKKSPKKYAKFRQNNNNGSPKKSLNEPSTSNKYPQNVPFSTGTRSQNDPISTLAPFQNNPISTPITSKYESISSPVRSQNDPMLTQVRSQNDPILTLMRSQNNPMSFNNEPILTQARSQNGYMPAPMTSTKESSTSATSSPGNPYPRRPNNVLITAIENHLNQTPKISQENAGGAVASMTITVHNNATSSQRIVQNAANRPFTESAVTPARPYQFRFPQARPFQFDPPHQKGANKKYAPRPLRPQVNMEHVNGEPPYQQRPPAPIRKGDGIPYREKQRPRNYDEEYDVHKKVIVTGFPAYTKPDELVQKLSGLGTPEIEIIKNRVAVIVFQTEQEAHTAVQANDTITVYGAILSIRKYTNQRHVMDLIGVNKRMARNERRNYDEENDVHKKVIVTGFPAYTKPDELVKKLSGLGTPEIEIIKNRVAVIVFQTEQEAHTAVQANDTITVYGAILSIRKYTNQRHVMDLIGVNKRMARNGHKAPPVAAPTEIDLSGDFSQQVQNIEDAIRLTQEEVDNINLLFEDVEKYMRMIFPTCEAVPFGSITTGLGIKSSDADCFLALQAGAGAGAGVGWGAGVRGAGFVSRAARLLRLHPGVFARLVPIPRANTPILKFLHVPTNVNCDLNSKTPLGVQNSRLLGHLLRGDARFGTAGLLLKYWARVHQLSGTGRLTNYALLLLLVFYLQRNLLPPVYKLQSAEHSFLVEHWEAGFDRSPLPFVREVPPLRDLLGGFFLYYADFDFDEQVVCPLIGRPLRKAEFESGVLPAQYWLYRRNIAEGLALPVRTSCCLCIQDPFELSHNVASAVSAALAADIKAYIKLAATAYTQEETTPGEFLRTILLTRPPAPDAGEARLAARVSLPARLLLDLDDDWQEVVRDLVLNVLFRDTFFVELTRRPAVSKEPGVELEVYYGTIKRPIWRRSNNLNGRGATPADMLACQQENIDRIVHESPNVADVCVPFEMELGFRSKPRGLYIITTPLGGADEDSFRSFRKFAHIFIHRWHKELLRPHLKMDPVRREPVNTEKAKNPRRSPKKQRKRNPTEPAVTARSGPTRADPPIESVAFVNSNHKDLSESVAAISLNESSKQNSKCDSDDES